MDSANHIQNSQEFLQCQAKSEGVGTISQRRSANYKPNIWKYDCVQSLTSEYMGETNTRQVEQLKGEVRRVFVEVVEPLAKLEFIDSIKKLGLANFFEEEIREAFDTIMSDKNNSPGIKANLYAAALCFRLLRQHGYGVSQDTFSGFMEQVGMFSKSTCTNVKGMIELFEASHLALEGENILDEAKAFSSGYLKEIISNLDNNLAKQVVHSLESPLHWRVQWFDIRWYIDFYEEEGVNLALLKLAKLNFNMVQAVHQKDLKHISRWWRNLGLIENLSFTRDRLVESFLCAVGFSSEPQHGSFRLCITKVIIFVQVLDDVYDVYGSLDELEQFTNAVDRWDSKEIQQLPESMKLCFQVLQDTTNAVANEIQKEKGWDNVLPSLQQAWANFCQSLFVEAKWYNKGYTPTLQEYLSNAWISSAVSLLSVHALFFSVPQEAKEEMVDFLEKNQELVYSSSLILRLCNDLGTLEGELERGDAASSVLCYMKEVNVSEEISREHIRGMTVKTWKNMNGHCIASSPLLQPIVNIITNIARVAQWIYQYGDGLGIPDRETKAQILSLLIEPLGIN
ncbi:hypothetical protein PVL29_012680 [Vitis rotundifolia]|uniref:Alpha-farnesene synthase n=1 Tax=Vitis rotundifolia TaxID=103349 RepID=A0AA38ZJD4_VITRO|nr:hypothetical protein PVL29_012680 [Vitis rotundifolia]